MIRFIKMGLAAFFALAVFTEPVGAQSEFFKDKTIRFMSATLPEVHLIFTPG